jgi:hypothetical protein
MFIKFCFYHSLCKLFIPIYRDAIFNFLEKNFINFFRISSSFLISRATPQTQIIHPSSPISQTTENDLEKNRIKIRVKEEFEIVLVHTANFFSQKQGAETASGKKCCYYELIYTSSDSKSNTHTQNGK